MIGFLRGLLCEKTPESLILDVNGVGYEVFVPASSFCALPPEGEKASLYIYTYVREDAIRLFGFATLLDRAMFLALLSVNSVGPKLALALLGPLTGEELCYAILNGERERLTAIPGVGAKTAERIVLELKGKCEKLLTEKEFYNSRLLGNKRQSKMGEDSRFMAESASIEDGGFPNAGKAASLGEYSATRSILAANKQILADAESALLNLGYKEKQIAELLKPYRQVQEPLVLENVLREVLKKLAKG